jgi:hypothetical protein
MPDETRGGDRDSGGRGKGSTPDAPRGHEGETSGKRSTGATKSANRPGASGTGAAKGISGSSSRRWGHGPATRQVEEAG